MSSQNKAFGEINDEQQKQYEREARLQYDPQMVNDSIRRWNRYSSEEQDAIKEEGNRIYSDMADAVAANSEPESQEVQEILARWHDHLQHFYEPTLEILRGLGELYNSSPDFIANFEKIHPDLPAFLQDSIAHYVDELETAEIERMLAEDEELSSRVNRLSM